MSREEFEAALLVLGFTKSEAPAGVWQWAHVPVGWAHIRECDEAESGFSVGVGCGLVGNWAAQIHYDPNDALADIEAMCKHICETLET